jgi:hypothetical protein
LPLERPLILGLIGRIGHPAELLAHESSLHPLPLLHVFEPYGQQQVVERLADKAGDLTLA